MEALTQTRKIMFKKMAKIRLFPTGKYMEILQMKRMRMKNLLPDHISTLLTIEKLKVVSQSQQLIKKSLYLASGTQIKSNHSHKLTSYLATRSNACTT